MTLRQSLTRPIRPLLLCLCAVATLSSVSGCGLFGSGGGTEIRLEPTGRYIVYNQEFTAAWCQVNADGQYDMVLVNQPQPTADGGLPLMPTVGGSPMQVLHVHVAWRPSSAMKPNYPAATNAAINWYVIDNHNPHDPQYLHYQGTGLVRMEDDDDVIVFDIKPTPVTLRHQKGALRDPIGPSRLSGEIKARIKPQKVADVLSSLEDIFRQTPSDAIQPPATQPAGGQTGSDQTGQ